MRPTPLPVPTYSVPPPILSNELIDDDFLSDLDRAFEQIQIAPVQPTRTKSRRKAKRLEREYQQMRNTFLEVTSVHLRPVLRYLKAIRLGVASRDLCEIVHYVVGPLIGKTRTAGLDDHAKALIAFQRRLKMAVKNPSRKLPEEQRLKLAESFDQVQKVFKLDFRGHSTAVVNLLGFYKTLKKNRKVDENDRRKLFAIGIPSLTMLRISSVDELVSLSGIHPEKIRSLRREARTFSPLSVL